MKKGIATWLKHTLIVKLVNIQAIVFDRDISLWPDFCHEFTSFDILIYLQRFFGEKVMLGKQLHSAKQRAEYCVGAVGGQAYIGIIV